MLALIGFSNTFYLVVPKIIFISLKCRTPPPPPPPFSPDISSPVYKPRALNVGFYDLWGLYWNQVSQNALTLNAWFNSTCNHPTPPGDSYLPQLCLYVQKRGSQDLYSIRATLTIHQRKELEKLIDIFLFVKQM